ncbi:MAG TPA: hypothetical protein VIF09_20850 [Polyangiaceae bacterium]|jgi:hypothetical protein
MRATLTLLVLAALAACGDKPAAASAAGSSAYCPGSQSSCLTAPECTYDPARACQMCHCSAPLPFPQYSPQGSPTPQ